MRTTSTPRTEDGTPYAPLHVHDVSGGVTSVSEGANGWHAHPLGEDGSVTLETDGHWHEVSQCL
jgi:hypothetical protein